MMFFSEEENLSEALIDGHVRYKYIDIKNAVNLKLKDLKSIPSGAIVAVVGEYNFNSIVLILSLLIKKTIVVPLESLPDKKIEIAGIEYFINATGSFKINETAVSQIPQKVQDYKKLGVAGIIFFTSGTTGHEKAVLHNFDKLFEKIAPPKNKLRTILFLKFNHLGGFNTFMKTWKSGGTIILTEKKDPESVLSAVETGKANLLPVSSSFLSIVLFGGYYNKFDISSLRYISYGAEAVSNYVLKELSLVLPKVIFLQTYGMTELGIIKIKSDDHTSSFMKLADKEYEFRVNDSGTLEIKPLDTSFVGYLNDGENIFKDGWFDTKDSVEIHGDQMRIVGRKSDIINIRGEKFFPQEVEEIIIQHPDVTDVVVSAQKTEMFSEIVKAKIVVKDGVDCSNFASIIKLYCRDKMEFYKIPVKIEVSNELAFKTIKKQRHL